MPDAHCVIGQADLDIEQVAQVRLVQTLVFSGVAG